MRLQAEFMIQMQILQGIVANDNQFGDLEFTFRNRATSELTAALAQITRDEGAP